MKRSSEILLLIMVGLNVLLGIGNITFFFTTWNKISNPIIIQQQNNNSTREPMIYFGDWDIEELYIHYEAEMTNGTHSQGDWFGTNNADAWVSELNIFSPIQFQRVWIADLDDFVEIAIIQQYNLYNYSFSWINIRDFGIRFGTDFWSENYQKYRIDVLVFYEYIDSSADQWQVISHLGPLPNGFSFSRDALKTDRYELYVVFDIYMEDTP